MSDSKLSGLAGKRALVTGATRGIGLEIARALSKAGSQVIIVGRNPETMEKAKKEIPNAEFVLVDLTDWNATREAISSVLPIQLLVNNAGLSILQPFGEVTEEAFDKVISSNVKSVLNVSQVVANDLRKRSLPGSIVNMSSIASTKPLVDHTSYCTSKHALDGLTACMSLELAPSVRVNSVHPTVTMTDMGRMAWNDPVKGGPMLKRIPLGRFAEISDVVSATLFLLSEEASFLHGVALPVDGGMTRL